MPKRDGASKNDGATLSLMTNEEVDEYPNRLAGKYAPIVTIFHFHQHANGRTYLVQPLRRSTLCDTDRCQFLLAEDVESHSASGVLGVKTTVASTSEL